MSLLSFLKQRDINDYLDKYCDQYGIKRFAKLHDIEKWGSADSMYFTENDKLIKSCKANSNTVKEMKVIRGYLGNQSKHINGYLRGSNNEHFWLNDIQILDQLLDQFKLRDNVLVIRRIPLKYFDLYRKKGTVVEKGYISTSLNLNYNFDYNGNEYPIDNEVLLYIIVPKGTVASYVDYAVPENQRRGEYELLIKKNSTIRILKKIRRKGIEYSIGIIVSQ